MRMFPCIFAARPQPVLVGGIAAFLALTNPLAWSAPPVAAAAGKAASHGQPSDRSQPLAGLSSRVRTKLSTAQNPKLQGGKAGVPISPTSLTSAPVSAFGFMPSVGTKQDPILPVPPLPLPAGGSIIGAVVHKPAQVVSNTLTAPSAVATPSLAAHSVVLDNSLGQNQQPVVSKNSSLQNDYAINSTMGKQVGGNLFFSFSSFSLASNESATFTGPASVHDILARVTGGNSSTIDGTISCQIPGANLFLLNPAGFIFGPNATINIRGSLVVSTADYMKFADGTRFDATPNMADDAALAGALVSGFGFVNPAPKGVQFSGSELILTNGAGLHVVAGDISLNGASLSASSGYITMFSIASAGEVPFSLAAPGAGFANATAAPGGTINIDQSSVYIDGNGGGSIVLFGGAITVNDAAVAAYNYGSSVGGEISVHTQLLTLEYGGAIESFATASGSGGAVSVQTSQLVIDGSNTPAGFTGIFAQSDPGATGNAGELTLNVTNSLAIRAGGQISTDTASSGNGGNLTVNAGSLSIDGSNTSAGFTGIFAQSSTGATGNAGELTVNVINSLAIKAGGAISTDTASSGNGGNLTVNAGSLSIDGSAAPGALTGISAQSDPGATGNAGNLTVQVTNALTIDNCGEIAASTGSFGKGGSLTVSAGSLTIDGSTAPNAFTGIAAESGTGATGDAGNLTVQVTNALTIYQGQIAVDTFSAGKGGSLTVSAGSLTIDGSAAPNVFTGIAAKSDTGSTGNGGDLTVNVSNSLTIRAGGQISAATFSSGNGGNLTVNAGSLTIDGSAAPNAFTGITANSDVGSTGNGGDLTVKVANALTIQAGGQISAGTLSSGKGGNVKVSAGTLSIDGTAAPYAFTGIAADSEVGATGNAGDLTVYVANALAIKGAGQISTATTSSGNGGNLLVRAGSLSIDGSAAPSVFTGIAVDSNLGATGNAGDLTLTVANALTINVGGQISAGTYSAGKGGNLTVTSGSLDIDGSAVPNAITGITANSYAGATGNAGNLTLTVANALTIKVGGQISAGTYSSGKGGNLTVTAGSLDIDGSAVPDVITGIEADSYAGATGSAGGLTISVAKALTINAGGEISSGTSSSGAGGRLTVSAGQLRIDGTYAPNRFTGISVDSLASGNAGDLMVSVVNGLIITGGGRISADTLSSGNAGSLMVNADKTLTITAGGAISAATFSSGNGGNLKVSAESMSLDGSATPFEFTGIAAQAASTGNAGDLTVSVAKDLVITRGGGISGSTFGLGNGGSVNVSAQDITIFGGLPSNESSSAIEAKSLSTGAGGTAGDVNIRAKSINVIASGEISSASSSTGRAGSVNIMAGGLRLDSGGIISTSSQQSDAGSINIAVASNIDMTGGSTISATAARSGGNIVITANGTILIYDSSVTATAGTLRSASGQGGAGGNITIDPQFIIFDHALISANAAIGKGGNILLQTDNFLTSESTITATGAEAGTVNIAAPELDLTNGLVQLSGSILNASSQLRDQCATRLNQDFSSFLVLGGGGVADSPEDAQPEVEQGKKKQGGKGTRPESNGALEQHSH